MLALPALKLLQVVPFEDHTPDTPTYVSVTTGQQPLRAGSSTAMRPERVSVGGERGNERVKDKCETDNTPQNNEPVRPMSSSSSSALSSISTRGESIKVNRPGSKEVRPPSHPTSRPTSANQHVRPSATVVTKGFSYAQVLKSTGQQSSTSSSSLISSRSETPSLGSVCLPQTQEEMVDKSLPSSRSTTPGTPHICGAVTEPVENVIVITEQSVMEDEQPSFEHIDTSPSVVKSNEIDSTVDNSADKVANVENEVLTSGNIVVGAFELEVTSANPNNISLPGKTAKKVELQTQELIKDDNDNNRSNVPSAQSMSNPIEVDSEINKPTHVSSNISNTVISGENSNEVIIGASSSVAISQYDKDRCVASIAMFSTVTSTHSHEEPLHTTHESVQIDPITTNMSVPTQLLNETVTQSRPTVVETDTTRQLQGFKQTTGRPVEVPRVTSEPLPLGSASNITYQHSVQSHPSSGLPIRAQPVPTTFLTARVQLPSTSHLPHSLVQPRSSIPQMTPAVQFPTQNPIPMHPTEFQKQLPLMPTPTMTSLPDQPFPVEGSAFFRSPLGDRPLHPTLPLSMPPVRSMKSNEQLEAIAKVKEYMAATQMLDAQRKHKSSSQGRSESPVHSDTTQRQASLHTYADTRMSSQQHMAKAKSVSRPQEMFPPRPVSQVSLPSQGAYYKQSPLLTQPPLARPPSLLPGQSSSGQPPHHVPHVPQLTAQQFLLMKHAQAAQMQAALIQYQQNMKQQQALKIAAALESSTAPNQSNRLPTEPTTAHYHSYSFPNQQVANPSLDSGAQQPVKSAFSPYPKTPVEGGRMSIQQVQHKTVRVPPVAQVAPSRAQELVHTSHDQQYPQSVEQENRKQIADMGKSSGLSVSATPFVPSTKSGTTDGGPSAPSTRASSLPTSKPVDRPLLPHPIMYHPNIQVRAATQASFPVLTPALAGATASALIGQPPLPIQLSQNLQQLTQAQVNSAALAAHQRNTSLTMGHIVPRPYMPVAENQLPNHKVLSLQQQQLLEQRNTMTPLARQISGEGSSSPGLRTKDTHPSGQRKPPYSPGNIELQPKQNMPRGAIASQKSGPKPEPVSMSPGIMGATQQNTLLMTPALTSANSPRRTALLPTPGSSHPTPVLLPNPPRATQTGGQQWQSTPRQVVTLSHNQASQLLAAQEQLRASSLYNTMATGSSGPRY